MNTSTTPTPATIDFAMNTIDEVIDELSARLDSRGFPVLEVSPENATVVVDASFDPDEYSVAMAAIEAAVAVGLSEDSVLSATLGR